MSAPKSDCGVAGFEKPVIFFDGICVLCNRFVDFVLKNGGANRFFFSPLQGKTAANFLGGEKDGLSKPALVYVDGEGEHRASDAVIKIVVRMGGWWHAAKVLMLVPHFIRDTIYNYVAANRYEWFGKSDACRLPIGSEADSFLD